jgi:hypothetical protein
VPERVVVDSATLGPLMDRLTRIADELTMVAIHGIDELPGSALCSSAAPGRLAAEVHRLSTALLDWLCSVSRSAYDLGAAEHLR